MSELHQYSQQSSVSFWQKSSPEKGQSGLRAANERRILSLIRQHHELPKAVIAKATGLSAQAATVIINKLEEDGLVLRGEPQRGKRGQPTIPFSLNPAGAFGIGIKVGRRSVQITLIDFVGEVRASLREQWAYPSVDSLQRFVSRGIRAIASTLDDSERQRVSGIGVAMPFEIWRWSEQANAPEAELAQWQDFDVLTCIQHQSDWPVFLCNDDTAACAAELWFGSHHTLSDYLYCFIGTFVGGGVVLNRQLHVGKTGNAGAIGSLPLSADGRQLLDQSSLHVLEKQLNNDGVNTEFLHSKQTDWPETLAGVEQWVELVSDGLCHAAISAHAFLDLDAVVIEGALPRRVLDSIVEACKLKLAEADLRGLAPIDVLPGTVGAEAQSIGSANLPLLALYSG